MLTDLLKNSEVACDLIIAHNVNDLLTIAHNVSDLLTIAYNISDCIYTHYNNDSLLSEKLFFIFLFQTLYISSKFYLQI